MASAAINGGISASGNNISIGGNEMAAS